MDLNIRALVGPGRMGPQEEGVTLSKAGLFQLLQFLHALLLQLDNPIAGGQNIGNLLLLISRWKNYSERVQFFLRQHELRCTNYLFNDLPPKIVVQIAENVFINSHVFLYTENRIKAS